MKLLIAVVLIFALMALFVFGLCKAASKPVPKCDDSAFEKKL